MKCQECNRDFPDHLVSLFFQTSGKNVEEYMNLCPICALEKRNEIHGLSDTKFQGEQANEMLSEARKIVEEESDEKG